MSGATLYQWRLADPNWVNGSTLFLSALSGHSVESCRGSTQQSCNLLLATHCAGSCRRADFNNLRLEHSDLKTVVRGWLPKTEALRV